MLDNYVFFSKDQRGVTVKDVSKVQRSKKVITIGFISFKLTNPCQINEMIGFKCFPNSISNRTSEYEIYSHHHISRKPPIDNIYLYYPVIDDDVKDVRVAKQLYFMFNVCHILFFVFPCVRFDSKYMRILRMLQSEKYKAQKAFSDFLFSSKYHSHLESEMKGFLSPGKVLPCLKFVFVQPCDEKERMMAGIKRKSEMRDARMKILKTIEKQISKTLNSANFSTSDKATSLIYVNYNTESHQCFLYLQKTKKNYLDKVIDHLFDIGDGKLVSDRTYKFKFLEDVHIGSNIQNFLVKKSRYFVEKDKDSKKKKSGKKNSKLFTLANLHDWCVSSLAFEELISESRFRNNRFHTEFDHIFYSDIKKK